MTNDQQVNTFFTLTQGWWQYLLPSCLFDCRRHVVHESIMYIIYIYRYYINVFKVYYEYIFFVAILILEILLKKGLKISILLKYTISCM